MKFLRNLLGNGKAWNATRLDKAELPQRNRLYRFGLNVRSRRSEIHGNRGPRSTEIVNRQFKSENVLADYPCLALASESKIAKANANCAIENREKVSGRRANVDINISRCSCQQSKSEFNSDATLTKKSGMMPRSMASLSASQTTAKPINGRSRAGGIKRSAATLLMRLSSACRRNAGLSGLGIVRLQYHGTKSDDEPLQLVFTKQPPLACTMHGSMNDVDAQAFCDVFKRSRNTDRRHALFPSAVRFVDVCKMEAHPAWNRSFDSRF